MAPSSWTNDPSSSAQTFADRREAGRRLAAVIAARRDLVDADPVVIGLPRGGVPVAAEVAAVIGAPLDVIVVRKVGVPYQPELALGAVGEGDVLVLDEALARSLRIGRDEIDRLVATQRAAVAERSRRFRTSAPQLSLRGRLVIIVDDGVATGATARAACKVAYAAGARRVVLAVPVAPIDAAERFAGDVDEFIALSTPESFMAVGQWYREFGQVDDDEVVALLRSGRPVPISGGAVAMTGARSESAAAIEVTIEVPTGPHGIATLAGTLSVPDPALGLVIFAHGSGSSRHSPRNRFVAQRLCDAGLATLLFDLLTEREERNRAMVFDIATLTERLIEVIRWSARRSGLRGLSVGLFGASTGAAAALLAAADLENEISAVVSRGGRPDLVIDDLHRVLAPTLFIVGGDDELVLDLNRQARARLQVDSALEIIPGADHLFSQPGALERVAQLATDWFGRHLGPASTNLRHLPSDTPQGE